MKRRLYLPLTSIILCSACAVGPKYQRPVAPATPSFKEMAGSDEWKTATPSDGQLKGKWWEIFNDPQLNELEERVSTGNFTVKQMEAQFRASRALVLGARANYYPTIGASPSVGVTGVGGNGSRLGGTTGSFSIPFSATWVPDLWGRVRLAVEAANANAQVSAADLENARLALQATLASDYFNLIGTDMEIALLQDTIKAYETYLTLTQNRYAGGVAAKSDVTLAQTQLFTTQANMTDLQVTRNQLEHAIAVTTGRAPAELSIPAGRIAGSPPPIPVAVPSTLLERRPDISAQERLIAAANANIGIAETAYYPTLSISASAALTNSSFANLFTWASRVWSVGPTLSQTLFDFGRRHATVENAEAIYDASVAAYRETVLSAFQQVEDNLSALRVLAQESEQQAAAVEAANTSLTLETDRYKAGTDSYLNVITTQTIALSDQREQVTLLQRRMVAAVNLIVALGGGWDASALPNPDQIRSNGLAEPASTQKVAQPVTH
ncbi:MAG TPA: efflux transporter outer membrane subunit [Bryobacteraceae bacterium]|nr:efflux transporter outer membrane subunit [Bryobacteraceae bacterium]